MQIPSISMLVIVNPREKIKYLGYFEFILCFGSAIGPVVGLILYSFFGYFYMFLIVGLSFLIFFPLMKATLPDGINESDDSASNLINNPNNGSNASEESQEISYFQLFSDPVIFLSSVGLILISSALTYIDPILSFRLQEFTDSLRIQSFVFSCAILGYSLNSLVVPFLAKYMSPIKLIGIGLLSCGLSNFLVGPSTILPNSIVIMTIGLLFSGLTMVLAIVPQLPLWLERAELKFPDQAREASDMLSSIYSATFSFGQFLGPVYGGYFKEILGYRN